MAFHVMNVAQFMEAFLNIKHFVFRVFAIIISNVFWMLLDLVNVAHLCVLFLPVRLAISLWLEHELNSVSRRETWHGQETPPCTWHVAELLSRQISLISALTSRGGGSRPQFLHNKTLSNLRGKIIKFLL